MHRLLLVEDDFLVRMLAKEALEEDGFFVLEAQSAAEAIGILNDQVHLDILVTDVRMPGKGDGVDVALHARSKFHQIPVIVTTGYADNIQERLEQHVPFAVTLDKPYRLDRLTALATSLSAVS